MPAIPSPGLPSPAIPSPAIPNPGLPSPTIPGAALPRAAAAAAAILALLILSACRPAPPAPAEEPLSITDLLGGADTAGFARALEPRPFRFPEDHGAHPEFRTEWWYFTGNLTAATPAARSFGFHLTFFRSALSPPAEPRESAWASTEVYMAHFAITDVEGGVLHSFERFSRASLGLAGADAAPFAVWLEDWSARATRTSCAGSRRHAAWRYRACCR